MIRPYKPSDIHAAVLLFRRSVHEVASRDYSPDQIAAWAPELPDLEAWARRLEAGGTFVDERDGRMAGLTRIDGAGCIDLLYVHPGLQRRGVARALVDAAISWAIGQGIRHLHADVSITARPFFERAGFRVVREQIVERQGVSLRNFRMERTIEGEPPFASDARQATRG